MLLFFLIVAGCSEERPESATSENSSTLEGDDFSSFTDDEFEDEDDSSSEIGEINSASDIGDVQVFFPLRSRALTLNGPALQLFTIYTLDPTLTVENRWYHNGERLDIAPTARAFFINPTTEDLAGIYKLEIVATTAGGNVIIHTDSANIRILPAVAP